MISGFLITALSLRRWGSLGEPAAAMIRLFYAAVLLLSLLPGYIVSRLYSEPLNRWLRSRYVAPERERRPDL